MTHELVKPPPIKRIAAAIAAAITITLTIIAATWWYATVEQRDETRITRHLEKQGYHIDRIEPNHHYCNKPQRGYHIIVTADNKTQVITACLSLTHNRYE